MKHINPHPDETPLEKDVRCWLNREARDGYDSVEDVLSDLLEHGCGSGMVGHLIYYTDTTVFYKKHQSDIDEMLYELLEDTGCSIRELFGDKWEKEDPLARGELNQNLLAWFGFEEAARVVANRSGIEA